MMNNQAYVTKFFKSNNIVVFESGGVVNNFWGIHNRLIIVGSLTNYNFIPMLHSKLINRKNSV